MNINVIIFDWYFHTYLNGVNTGISHLLKPSKASRLKRAHFNYDA